MALIADKRDYKKGYNRNIASYKVLTEKNVYSKRMLLFYSVECGLKYLLLNKWGIVDLNQIEKESEQEKLLYSHNINAILKELGYQGMITFPVLRTIHNDPVNIEAYHQVCRYGIRIAEQDVEKEKRLEASLNQVANWILERI